MTDEKFRNLPVGENFVCGNKKLLVSQSESKSGCSGCYFHWKDCITPILPYCCSKDREDGLHVVFVEVENGK